MTKEELLRLIETAGGKRKADIVIKNGKIVDLGAGKIRQEDLAICGRRIAGIGPDYEGEKVLDAEGAYILPGLMDAHIHIESSYLSPEAFAQAVVPWGTTTVIADPHEIVNVAGLAGLRYMQEAASKTPLKIEYMVPSCVPSTAFETTGASLFAKDLAGPLMEKGIAGLAELMNFPGVLNGDPDILDKIMAAKSAGKPIDGHAPGLLGKGLCAYASAGILADHESSTLEEMDQRLKCGMRVLIRQGSSCHDLENLLPGVNAKNYSRCLFCSDDRQAQTLREKGHLNEHLKLAVSMGLDPLMAVSMASLNTAEAFGLGDRGALFPGRAADFILVEDLKDFLPRQVFIDGRLVAKDGKYLPDLVRADASQVKNSFHLKNFSEERLKFHLKKDQVKVIEVLPGGVLTKKSKARLALDEAGDVLLGIDQDLCRLAVVERHKGTGNVGLGLIGAYGLRKGAIAVSIAHDSHNIICCGKDPREMAMAIEELARQEGGIVLVLDGQVLSRLPLPIGGLMSDQDADFVAARLADLEKAAHEKLGVSPAIDPVMTLSFMSLAVIPELKLTDLGLFDVSQFRLVPLEDE